jgi:protein-disulfide isomerase
MNRQRLIAFSVLVLIFVGVSLLYFLRAWNESSTRFRTGLPVPQSVLQSGGLLSQTDIIPSGPPTQPNIRPDDPLLSGSASSKVTLMVFGDFQCETCKDQAAAIHEALVSVNAPADIRTVWRDYPITRIHERALAAAVAGRCAAQQGKFPRMHDALFFQSTDLSETDLLALAKAAGLRSDTFLTCLRDPAIPFRIQQDIDEAIHTHAITAVPTLFINGKPVNGYVDAGTLAAILKRELQSTQTQ